MSIRLSRQARYLVGFAAALAMVAALTFFVADGVKPTSGAGGGPAMKLVITDPPNACSGNTCEIATGSAFTLGVEITGIPSQGYVTAQSYVWYGPNITWDPNVTAAADDFVWPDCDPAVALRFQQVSPGAIDPPPVSEVLAHGCATAILPPLPVSTYVGIFATMVLQCSPDETGNPIQLLPSGPRTSIPFTSGSLFVTPSASQVIPKLSGLTVYCGTAPTPTVGPTNTPGGATDTPTPTPTPTPTVTPTPGLEITPTPTFISVLPCGDVNGDLLVNSQDALWVLWYATGVIPYLPFPDDVDGDGVIGPIDALFILWIELNMYRCL